MVVSDFPPGNFDIAKNVRQQQKRKWEEGPTNKEPTILKNKTPKVKFDKVSMFLSACSSGDLDEAKQLLNYGLDINSANPDGLTALHQACIYDKLDVVEFLLNNGADINCADPEGWTPLHCAAYCGYSDITKLLIEKRADMSALNSNCELPLDLAKDKPDIFELVLSAMKNLKIDAELAKRSEETQLIEDARCWIRNGIPPSTRHPGSGATPLHVAAAKGYLEAIQLLLEAGGDIEARDNDEWTPLMAAAHWSQLNACDLLLRAGAKTNVSSRMGYDLDDIVADDIRSELKHLITQNESRVQESKLPSLPVAPGTAEVPVADSTGVPKSSIDGSEADVPQTVLKEELDFNRSVPQTVLKEELDFNRSVGREFSSSNNANVNVPSPLISLDQKIVPGTFPVPEPPAAVAPAVAEETIRANGRGTIVPVEDQQLLDKKSTVASTVSSSEELLHANGSSRINSANSRNGFRQPLAYGGNNVSPAPFRQGSGPQQLGSSQGSKQMAQPVTALPSYIGRTRPVSANLSGSSSVADDESSNFFASTPKLSTAAPIISQTNSHKAQTLDDNISNIASQKTHGNSGSNSTSGVHLGPGISRALAEEFNKVAVAEEFNKLPSTPAVDLSSSSSSMSSSPSPPSPSSPQPQSGVRRAIGQRPLSTLVASEDGAANRIQQQSTRSVPVFSMVHRGSSTTSSSSRHHTPAVSQNPASPHPSRYGITTTTITTPVPANVATTLAVSMQNSLVNGSTSSLNTTAMTNSNDYASRLRTPPYQVMSRSTSSLAVPKESTGRGSLDDSSSSSGGMVAVLATPVTAVTPQHSSTAPSTSVITPTPPSSSTTRSATDEAEAERKARARHNRQTRRATQGVTLEDFNQAKNIATTDNPSNQSVLATAALVNTSIGIAPSSSNTKALGSQNSLQQGPVSASATPVIGTVSPITHITPSVVYAASAMASSNPQSQVSNSMSRGFNNQNGGQTSSVNSSSSVPAVSVPANNVAAASSQSSAAATSASSRRRQPPRRSTGISQADVSEAAEVLASGTTSGTTSSSVGTSSSAAETTSSLHKSLSSAASAPSSSTGTSSTLTRREQPAKAGGDVMHSSATASASSSATSSFLVEYDRLYELERAENDRLKTQGRQLSTQLTELQRDKRQLQRRVSELEEETRELERLRAENQRLKDENCALIRVISKLSK